MANLKHVVTDLHQVYLTEMEAKIKPQIGSSSGSSSESGGEKKSDAGGGEDSIKKAARQLAYDTRYKARREGIPLERAFAQSSANSKASAPVKDAAKAMLFSGPKEEVEVDAEDIQELKKGDKEMVRVTPKKGYGKGYVRFADRKKQNELRKNPQIQSVTGTNYGEPYEGKYKLKPGENKNTVGDKDGDGTKEPDKHEYAGVKDKAIKTAMKKDKKKNLKASFSNWRAGLTESQLMEITGEEKKKKITEKTVKNTIVINPELKEAVAKLGGEVVDVEELTQEQVAEILKDQITENLLHLEEIGVDIHEISAQLALTASQKADNERRKAAVAGDKDRAAKKAAQASRLYAGVGPRRARERAQQVKK